MRGSPTLLVDGADPFAADGATWLCADGSLAAELPQICSQLPVVLQLPESLSVSVNSPKTCVTGPRTSRKSTRSGRVKAVGSAPQAFAAGQIADRRTAVSLDLVLVLPPGSFLELDRLRPERSCTHRGSRRVNDSRRWVGALGWAAVLGADFDGVLAAARGGDEQAFGRLWRDVQPGLLRYLQVIGAESVDDVASEAWLEVARRLPTFGGDEPAFRGWLFTIARRRVIDAWRRSARRPIYTVPDPHLYEGPGPDYTAEGAAVEALADLLSAAAGQPSDRELAGQTAAVAAFVRERDVDGHRRHATGARRRSMLATLLGTKLAAAAAAGAVGFGGLAAAAYAGALPEPIQDFAHQTVGAPAASGGHTDPVSQVSAHRNSEASEHANAGQSSEPVGPDPTGSAGYGLCTAFAEEKAENGKVDTKSVAYRALVEAAGGADNIDEFCAGVTSPSEDAGMAGSPSTHADSSIPSDSSHPTGQPSDLPDGSPVTPHHPTAKPTGLPTP
jgi:DNA-directed RNA polymerase specialized sigma24 family protein